MKLPSFRLRIALLSAALAGTTLVGFSAVSWLQIYDAKLSRLDAELLNQLMRAAPNLLPPREPPTFFTRENFRPPMPEPWQRYEELLSSAFGGNAKTPIVLLVLDAEGNQLYESPQTSPDSDLRRLLLQNLQLAPQPQPPRPLPNLPLRPPRPPQFVTQKTTSGSWRIGATKFPRSQVAIAVSLQTVNQEMAAIRNIYLVSIPIALLLVTSGAWLVSGSALRPIRQLTAVIQQVSAKGLDQRIPIGTTDVEFVELIQVFNQMLERLESSFTQASRFSADAAHELKTPLTILQGELERTLQQVEPGSEVQQQIGRAHV